MRLRACKKKRKKKVIAELLYLGVKSLKQADKGFHSCCFRLFQKEHMGLEKFIAIASSVLYVFDSCVF